MSYNGEVVLSRVGFLGPGDVETLMRATEMLLFQFKADRVLYLGTDHALSDAIEQWAKSLVGEDPSEEGLFLRAMDVLQAGHASRLESFLRRERTRARLRVAHSLPPGGARVKETIGGCTMLCVADRDHLDQVDLQSAAYFIFGLSEVATVKQSGTRWFLSPGPCQGDSALIVEGPLVQGQPVQGQQECTALIIEGGRPASRYEIGPSRVPDDDDSKGAT